MESARCKAFVTAAETGSFSKAGEVLGYTPSGVSQLVTSLERELGLPLLGRNRKGVTLTENGRRLLPAVREFLQQENRIYQLAGEMSGLLVGSVTIATYSSVATHWLPAMMMRFQQEHPQVEFELFNGDYHDVDRWLADGSVDLALVGNTFEEPDCCFIPFRTDKLVIATPVNEHYLKYQVMADLGTLDFSDFLDEPFIMRESGSGTKKEIDRYLESHNIPDTSLHVVARMNDLEAIRKSVAEGLGISILSACSAQDLAATHQILMFPLNHEKAMRTFYIVYSKNRILKPHVKQFLRFVQHFYQ